MIHLTRSQSQVLAVSVIAIFIGGLVFLSRKEKTTVVHKLESSESTDAASSSTESPTAPAGNPTELAPEILPSSAKSDPTPIDLSTAPATSTSPSGTYMLHNFHRSENKNGKKAWEVEAKSGIYNPLTQQAEIEEARVHFFRDNGETIELTAPMARIRFDGLSLSQADLSGGVHVLTHDNLTIDTAHAIYKQQEKRIDSDSAVKVSNQMLDINGKAFSVDLDNNVVRFTGGVKTILKPRK